MRKRSVMLCVLGVAMLAFAGCGAETEKTDTKEEATITAEANENGENTQGSEGGNTENSGNQNEAGSSDASGNNTDKPQATPEPTKAPERDSVVFQYPTFYTDAPDPDIIRVGENYYMVSTTMNMCPGAPIMKSVDLVHWEIVNYVYDTFEDDDVANLRNGRDMYARGSWAASLKYDESAGLYYVAFNSNDHGFYIYTTTDIENGVWKKFFCRGSFHDPALFLENDKLYVISASGSCSIQELSLDDEKGEVVKVGSSKRLFSTDKWSLWEGAHAYKVEDMYYICIIASPKDRWMRTQLCYRSADLFSTDWEEKIIYQGGAGTNGAGLAQGGIIQTQYGDWYAFLFQDSGAIGRVPSIAAVEWKDGWPMVGALDVEGKFHSKIDYIGRVFLKASETGNYVVDSDEFEYAEGEPLKKVWQWNHNPQNDYWSVTENPGYLRLTTDTLADNVCYAHNSLTQRTMGPKFTSEIKLNTDGLKAGDYAGLCAVSDHYAMVGVLCDEQGKRHIYQANAEFKQTFEAPNEVLETEIADGQDVYLRIAYDFKSDSAEFFYSLDGEEWIGIGNNARLGFSTATTFMGTRTWLYHYATTEAGGYADFDYYKEEVSTK